MVVLKQRKKLKVPFSGALTKPCKCKNSEFSPKSVLSYDSHKINVLWLIQPLKFPTFVAAVRSSYFLFTYLKIVIFTIMI